MPERAPPDLNQPADEHRVIDIRSGRPALREARPAAPSSGAIDEFSHDDDEPDDFRHRMMTNAIAFLFIAALIGAGLWLADSLASMRKNQDCVLSGKRGCSPVETVPSR